MNIRKRSIELIKNNPKFWMFFLFCFGMFGVQSCKKDPKCYDPSNVNCENYNPCYGKETINVLFRVKPGNNGFPPEPSWCKLIACDTIHGSSILFEIPDGNPDYCTYEWQIGDEPEPRYDDKFEVDFSDYLDQGKWQTYIPISLTIRTHTGNCLKNPADTLVTVTRNLFFTRHKDFLMTGGYIGYLRDNPSNIFELKINSVYQDWYKGYYTGGVADFFIGFPFADSVMIPESSSVEICNNYRQDKCIVVRENEPKFSALTHDMKQYDCYFLDNDSIILRLEFLKDNNTVTYEFKGKRQ